MKYTYCVNLSLSSFKTFFNCPLPFYSAAQVACASRGSLCVTDAPIVMTIRTRSAPTMRASTRPARRRRSAVSAAVAASHVRRSATDANSVHMARMSWAAMDTRGAATAVRRTRSAARAASACRSTSTAMRLSPARMAAMSHRICAAPAQCPIYSCV